MFRFTIFINVKKKEKNNAKIERIFCVGSNCFDKKNQQENIQRGRDQTPSSDHSLHPSSSFIVDGGLSLTSNRSDIFLN